MSISGLARLGLTSNFWILAAVVASNAIGQVLFKLAADSVRSEMDFWAIASALIRSPVMWLALCFYGATVVIWIWVLRIIPLSIAYSSVALVFVIVPLAGFFLFDEPVSIRFVFGALLIGFGVWLACFG